MDLSLEKKQCSFCGQPGSTDRQLSGGLGAMICAECVAYFHATMQSPELLAAARTPPWETMTDTELLEQLPRIQRSAEQVSDFAAEWIEMLRERRVSWAAIGAAMGVSRQAAWERYAVRVSNASTPTPRQSSGTA